MEQNTGKIPSELMDPVDTAPVSHRQGYTAMLALSPILLPLVLCESCSLLWEDRGVGSAFHATWKHTPLFGKGEPRPCPAVSLQTTSGSSTVLLATTCHMLERLGSCRADAWPPLAWLCGPTLFLTLFPVSSFILYHLFATWRGEPEELVILIRLL